MAAKRDQAKIDALEETGRSKAQIAKNKKEQIAREGIKFETIVGRDFLEQLDKDSFTHSVDPDDYLPKKHVVTRGEKRRRRAKHILLIPLYLISFGVLQKPSLYMSAYFENDKTSYYAALDNVRKNNDLIGWCKYFLTVLIKTAEDGKKTFIQIKELEDSVNEITKQMQKIYKY